MERIGYYAKNKATGNLHKYHFGITDEGDDIFFVVMGEEQNISATQDWTTTISGQILEIGLYTTEYNTNPNLTMHIDDDEWEKEMGR